MFGYLGSPLWNRLLHFLAPIESQTTNFSSIERGKGEKTRNWRNKEKTKPQKDTKRLEKIGRSTVEVCSAWELYGSTLFVAPARAPPTKKGCLRERSIYHSNRFTPHFHSTTWRKRRPFHDFFRPFENLALKCSILFWTEFQTAFCHTECSPSVPLCCNSAGSQAASNKWTVVEPARDN